MLQRAKGRVGRQQMGLAPAHMSKVSSFVVIDYDIISIILNASYYLYFIFVFLCTCAPPIYLLQQGISYVRSKGRSMKFTRSSKMVGLAMEIRSHLLSLLR